jgi:hypothetical protein
MLPAQQRLPEGTVHALSYHTYTICSLLSSGSLRGPSMHSEMTQCHCLRLPQGTVDVLTVLYLIHSPHAATILIDVTHFYTISILQLRCSLVSVNGSLRGPHACLVVACDMHVTWNILCEGQRLPEGTAHMTTCACDAHVTLYMHALPPRVMITGAVSDSPSVKYCLALGRHCNVSLGVEIVTA